MKLYKILIDENRRILALPAWANPDERSEGEQLAGGWAVVSLDDSQASNAVPNHSTLTVDNKVVIDDDYVPPVEPSSEPRPDPNSAAIAALSATVAKQGIMIANLALQIAKMKVGK